MKKTKNKKQSVSLKEAALKTVLSAAIDHKRLRGGKYHLCPACWSLDVVLTVGLGVEDFSTYCCRKCGLIGKYFPEFSVKELRATAKKLSQKNLQKNRVKKRVRRKN